MLIETASVVEDNQKVGLEAAILKEFVTDHWSSLRARKMDGAQTGHRYTDPSKEDEVARRCARVEARS